MFVSNARGESFDSPGKTIELGVGSQKVGGPDRNLAEV